MSFDVTFISFHIYFYRLPVLIFSSTLLNGVIFIGFCWCCFLNFPKHKKLKKHYIFEKQYFASIFERETMGKNYKVVETQVKRTSKLTKKSEKEMNQFENRWNSTWCIIAPSFSKRWTLIQSKRAKEWISDCLINNHFMVVIKHFRIFKWIENPHHSICQKKGKTKYLHGFWLNQMMPITHHYCFDVSITKIKARAVSI